MAEQDVRLQRGSGLLLGLRWVLTFSPILPFSIAIALLISLLNLSLDRVLILWLVLASALTCALLIGLMQKHVLNNYINVGRQWIVATASGIGILWPLAIGVFFVMQTVPIPDWPEEWEEIARWGWSIAWIATGVAQYLLLKEHWQRAAWWILANAIAGIVGPLLGSLVGGQLSTSRWWPELQPDLYTPPHAWIAGITVAAVTSGAFTGIVLVWLIRQRLVRSSDSI